MVSQLGPDAVIRSEPVHQEMVGIPEVNHMKLRYLLVLGSAVLLCKGRHDASGSQAFSSPTLILSSIRPDHGKHTTPAGNAMTSRYRA